MMKRHEVQVLRRAGVTQEKVAKLTGISERAVRMIEAEEPVLVPDDEAERQKRGIGRPSKAEPFRSLVAKVLAEDPELLSLEVLRRARLDGYQGGKSALYALISSLRPRLTRPMVRFEGLPGEFAQHDFGHVDVRFMDGSAKRIHFFASRLKYSRWVEVSIVLDERLETLVRRLVDHFAAFGGVPLLSVLDYVARHVIEDGDPWGTTEPSEGALVELGLDPRAGAEGEEPDRLAAVAEGEDEEAGTTVVSPKNPVRAPHRPRGEIRDAADAGGGGSGPSVNAPVDAPLAPVDGPERGARRTDPAQAARRS